MRIAQPFAAPIPDLTKWTVQRETIARQLRLVPIDEQALRVAISSYARATRPSGITSGQLIRSIGELVAITPRPLSQRARLMQVIALSCIDAFFGPRGARLPRRRYPTFAESH
jgi:hypothetical protein